MGCDIFATTHSASTLDKYDPLQELSNLIEEAGLVLYYTPPPNRQQLANCTCSWPKGYPGRPKLNPQCHAHRWVPAAQAKKAAERRTPEERWEGEDLSKTIGLRAENERLMARLRSVEVAAKNVVVDLARERRVAYEDPEEGDEFTMAKDLTEASAIELAKVLGGDTIPDWALNPPKLELPFETLEKIA